MEQGFFYLAPSPLHPSISSPVTPFCSKAAKDSGIIGNFNSWMAYIKFEYQGSDTLGNKEVHNPLETTHSLCICLVCFMRHGEFSGNLCPWEGYRILLLYGLNFCKSCIRFNRISPANMFLVQHLVGSCCRVPQCQAGD